MISNKTHQINAKDNIYLYFLILQIGIFLSLNILWEYNSFIMPFDESFVHIQYTNSLTDFNINQLIHAPYPRLIHYLTVPLLKIYADKKWAYFTISAIFVCMNVMFTYLCTMSLCSKKTAFFAATALLWLPLNMIACRTYTLDYPQAAVITLWLLCFLKSRHFSKTFPSICFIILIFVSSLIKYSYFTYIIPCFICMVYHLFRNSRSQNLKKKHLFAATLFLSYAVIIFFTDGWIAGLKSASIILILEGIFLYQKDNGTGRLFFFTGIGLLISNSFFSIYANQDIINQLGAYQHDTVIGINYIYCNFYFFLITLSLLLRAILIVIKMRLLTSVLFWFFLAGSVLIIGKPKLRRKYSLLLFPLIASPLYMLFTSTSDRYQYPLLSFYCMISAIWLCSKGLDIVKNALYFFGIAMITICGIYLSGGWLINSSSCLPAHRLAADCANGDCNAKINAYFYNDSQFTHYKIESCGKNYLNELLSFKSQWSDNLLYTFDTYNISWKDCFAPLTQLPNNSTLSILLLLNDTEYNYIQTDLVENIILFYAKLSDKEIVFSKTGNYILSMQYAANMNENDIQTEEPLPLNISKDTEIVKKWTSWKYLFTLYKRKN